MTDIGTVHAASVLEAPDGTALLALKGDDGTATVHVPEDMVSPLEMTMGELSAVYGGAADGTLVGECDGGDTDGR